MDAQTTTTRFHWRSGETTDGLVVVLRRWLLAALCVLLLLSAVLIVWRRAAGQLLQPLPAGSLLLCGLVLAGVGIAIRSLWLQCRPSSLRIVVLALPMMTLLPIAAALSLPEHGFLTLAAFWTILAVEEFSSVGLLYRRTFVPGGPWAGVIRPSPRAESDDTEGEDLSEAPPDRQVRFDPPQEHAPHFPAADVYQQTTRGIDAEGCDVMSGYARADFAAGQRFSAVHLAFCPPFARVPSVTTDQADGPPVRIKPTQQAAFGTRLELKLEAIPAEPTSVVIEFAAQCAEK